MKEIYFVSDCESDGPQPGKHSLLSFATAAFTIDKVLLGTFSRNLNLLPNGIQDQSTMEFWKDNIAAYNLTRLKTVSPKQAFEEYLVWINKIGFHGRPLFCAKPLGYDWKFIDWYFLEYVGRNPYGLGGLDIKSYACGMLQKDYKSLHKKELRQFMDPLPHTHVALDDALETGCLTVNLIRRNLSKPMIEGYTRSNEFNIG